MKRIYIFGTLAALTLALSGCYQEVEVAPEEEVGEYHIVLSARNGDATKTALTGGTGEDRNTIRFTATDEISLFDGAQESNIMDTPVQWKNNNRFTIPEGKCYSDGSADFEGTVKTERADYVALYPYNAQYTKCFSCTYDPAFYDEKPGFLKNCFDIYTFLYNNQNAVEGSFDPAANIAVGPVTLSEDGKYTMQLHNACAMLKFSVPDEGYNINWVVLYSNDMESPLAGQLKIRTFKDNEHAPITTFDEDSDDQFTRVYLRGDLVPEKDYYIVVAPGTLEGGFTITAYDENEIPVYTRTTTKSVTFKRNTIYNLGVLPAKDLIPFRGNGTEADPYLIERFENLKMLSAIMTEPLNETKYAGKYFKQTADIDCGGEPITIGSTTADGQPIYFSGIYDGDGHSITNYAQPYTVGYKKNVKYEMSFTVYHYGLFNQVRNATIKNLTVTPSKLMVLPELKPTNAIYAVGALIGFAKSSESGTTVVSGCTVGEASYEYDLTPYTTTPLAEVEVNVGGLIGRVVCCNLKVDHCVNNASIKISGSCSGEDNPYDYYDGLGGLIGMIVGDEEIIIGDKFDRFDSLQDISFCRNRGNLTLEVNSAFRPAVGGLVGYAYESFSTHDVTVRMWNCVNQGDVTLGYTSSSDMANAELTGYAAGIVGRHASDGDESHDPYIYNSLNKGDIAGHSLKYEVSGIYGYCYDDDTHIASCVNVGKLSNDRPENTTFTLGKVAGICGGGGGEFDGRPDYDDGALCVNCFWFSPDEPDNIPCIIFGKTHKCHSFDESLFWGEIKKSIVDDYDTNLSGKTSWSKAKWAEAAELWDYAFNIEGVNTIDLKF